MFKFKNNVWNWVELGVTFGVIAILGVAFIVLQSGKQLENINGIKNGLFYEKRIQLDIEGKGNLDVLDIAKLDSMHSLFTTETYITPKPNDQNLKPQPIDSLKIIKEDLSQDSLLQKNLEITSLFKNFLDEKKITNKNFQKIKSVQQLNKVFPKEFFSFLQEKTLKQSNPNMLQEVMGDWKNLLLPGIKEKYNAIFFEENDLIILKGLTTYTSTSSDYSHTPSIYFVKSFDSKIEIIIDFGKQRAKDDSIKTKIYNLSTTHFIAIPKGLSETIKVSYIYSILKK